MLLNVLVDNLILAITTSQAVTDRVSIIQDHPLKIGLTYDLQIPALKIGLSQINLKNARVNQKFFLNVL